MSRDLSDSVLALKSKGAFRRLGNAVKYSYQGLAAALKYEAAVRTEIVALCALSVLLWFTPLPTAHYFVLMGSVLCVIVVELLNSAIEAAVDLACPDLHPLAGRAKDMGSAAVFITIMFSCALWVWLAVPVWWNMILLIWPL